jgi:type VI secretion system protein ImpF
MNYSIGRNRREELVGRPQLPLLDRLADDTPETPPPPSPSLPRSAGLTAAEAARALRRSVRRDIEALLNARRRWRSWPDGYRELAVSPVGYGITDFGAGAFNEASQRDRLRAQIEQTIRRFEPRLAQVKVVLLDSSASTLDPTLRLRIEALLRIEPAPEPIVFDTLVEPATAEVQVKANSTERPASDV